MRQSEIYDIVFLENSRLIFSGIEELHKKMKHRNIEEYVKEQCEACFPENGAEKRENNPLYPFFDFLKKEKQHLPRTNDDFWISETVNMLTLYNVIDQLQKEEKKERYPYLFEALCNSMREIMNSEICYLLYSQRDQIQMLSMSGFPDDMVSIPEDHNKKMDRSNMQLTQADFNELRKWIIQRRKNKDRESQRNHWDVAETLYAPKMNANQNLVVMVLNYPKYPQSSWKGEWIYLVFQYHKAIPDRATIADDGSSRGSQGHEKWLEWNKLLVSARNLLYLRNQIMEQCNEKLYILLVSQRSYQYVMPLFPPDSRKIRILHLTDLHLSERNKKHAWDFLDTYDWDAIKPVDLIVVTGDCIQGNNQAGVLEERYGIADSFIRKLAVRLWSEQGFVRADWRKRIFIIPGNHDYASMNELEAMSLPGDKRSTGLGYPARKEGGPMVKFAYYIKFVCSLLGLDMNELIANDLNEVRHYRQMQLALYGINTVAEISPLRTNKVSLSKNELTNMLSESGADDCINIMLCHHSPKYSPDYLLDRYAMWRDNISESEQKEWISEFHKLLQEIDLFFRSHLKKSGSQDGIETVVSDFISRLKKISGKIYVKGFSEYNASEYDLLWDIIRTISTLEDNPGFNEQISNLSHELNRDEQMAKLDQNQLEENFKELFCMIPFHLVLSGHTHELKFLEYKDLWRNQPEILCVEGDQMFKGEKISFGLITIDNTSRTIEWCEQNIPKKRDSESKTTSYWI